MPRGKFHFIPSARLQKYLGTELIADPDIAVAEFVKNAYDAGASEVHVELQIFQRPSNEQVLTISDNGIGMSRPEFKVNWMQPGYSAKTETPRLGALYKDAPAAARKRARSRVPTGEKGLGRLAAARLGKALDVFTRKSRDEPWLHVHFDWKRFEESMDERLDAVPVYYDDSEPPEPRFRQGTIVRISDLTVNWSGRIPGRKVAGRPDSRLGRLRQDLGILLQPDAVGIEDFQIFLTTDESTFDSIHGPVAATLVEEADYSYEFEFVNLPKGPGVKRRIHRAELLAKRLGKPRVSTETRLLADLAAEAQPGQLEARPATLRSGPYTGRFWYFPSFTRRYAELGRSPGIFLYRDRLRVDPYGHEDDDWLGAKARKASRQGYAAIQPKLLAGRIVIGKAANPDLIDMSNRQGLVENPAYEDFIAQARAEFQHFEHLVFEEYVKHEWTSVEVKAQRAAHDQLQLYTGLLRSLIHSLRQPVAGLALDLRAIRNRITALDVADAIKKPLLDAIERAQEHVTDIDQVINRLFEINPEATLSAARISDLLQGARHALARVTAASGVKLSINAPPDATILTHPESVIEVLAELSRNAVEAIATKHSGGNVSISATPDTDSVIFAVEDDGPGVAIEVRDGLFRANVSTKGRPGSGLLQASLIAKALGGGLSFSSTPGHTRFELKLPILTAQ